MGVQLEEERRFFNKVLWGLRIVHCYTPLYAGMIQRLRREDQNREPMVNTVIIQMSNYVTSLSNELWVGKEKPSEETSQRSGGVEEM